MASSNAHLVICRTRWPPHRRDVGAACRLAGRASDETSERELQGSALEPGAQEEAKEEGVAAEGSGARVRAREATWRLGTASSHISINSRRLAASRPAGTCILRDSYRCCTRRLQACLVASTSSCSCSICSETASRSCCSGVNALSQAVSSSSRPPAAPAAALEKDEGAEAPGAPANWPRRAAITARRRLSSEVCSTWAMQSLQARRGPR
mmetsp:Transcript_58222/g.169018  ORF Transcript_58222/g.169018 Transcript_58222/m.169018 type:complete len:210 (-) Transcript_58222:266-895(-)